MNQRTKLKKKLTTYIFLGEFENKNIIGSINVGAGATIDDLIFKKYKTQVL